MRVFLTDHSLRQIKKMPKEAKRKFEKQIGFLSQNLQYPSLHAKKYDEAQDIWQARVDDHYRFYFAIREDVYVILNVTKHPK